MTAELLIVSPDTVYDLFKKGELPGRKIGRKWLTARSAVLLWMESTSQEDTLARAIEQGDAKALADALKNGQIQVNKRVWGDQVFRDREDPDPSLTTPACVRIWNPTIREIAPWRTNSWA